MGGGDFTGEVFGLDVSLVGVVPSPGPAAFFICVVKGGGIRYLSSRSVNSRRTCLPPSSEDGLGSS